MQYAIRLVGWLKRVILSLSAVGEVLIASNYMVKLVHFSGYSWCIHRAHQVQSQHTADIGVFMGHVHCIHLVHLQATLGCLANYMVILYIVHIYSKLAWIG